VGAALCGPPRVVCDVGGEGGGIALECTELMDELGAAAAEGCVAFLERERDQPPEQNSDHPSPTVTESPHRTDGAGRRGGGERAGGRRVRVAGTRQYSVAWLVSQLSHLRTTPCLARRSLTA
jgi:hypothetical protein